MNNINLIEVDIAKDVFQLYGVDEKGEPVLRKRPCNLLLSKFNN
jgi:hypothetical protein